MKIFKTIFLLSCFTILSNSFYLQAMEEIEEEKNCDSSLCESRKHKADSALDDKEQEIEMSKKKHERISKAWRFLTNKLREKKTIENGEEIDFNEECDAKTNGGFANADKFNENRWKKFFGIWKNEKESSIKFRRNVCIGVATATVLCIIARYNKDKIEDFCRKYEFLENCYEYFTT